MRGGTLNSVDVYSLEDIISLQQEGITNRDAKEWIKDKITELYNNDNLYTGENNFAIAEGVIIENITTGSGDDTIRDNMVDNIISTGLGDDKIYIGAGGYDHINGGEGSDNLYINLLQEQVTIEQIDKETYNIIADSFEAEIIGVERVYFTDNSFVDL
jgi:Ca2+-binding RTX toxin-like protein